MNFEDEIPEEGLGAEEPKTDFDAAVNFEEEIPEEVPATEEPKTVE